MTHEEQKQFIEELTENVKKDLLEQVEKYPETWDGIELRWKI